MATDVFQSGLFGTGGSYSFDGALIVGGGTEAHGFAKKTVAGTVISGSTMQVHDYVDTTYMYWTAVSAASTVDHYILYDLFSKRRVKSIEVDFAAWETGAGAAAGLQVAGSHNGSSWTEIHYGGEGSSEVRNQWAGGDVKYRYIRIGCKGHVGNDHFLKLYGVRIII